MFEHQITEGKLCMSGNALKDLRYSATLERGGDWEPLMQYTKAPEARGFRALQRSEHLYLGKSYWGWYALSVRSVR